MTLDEFMTLLTENPAAHLQFLLPDQSAVPAHYHVTEVGRVRKDFVDCGGTTRKVEACVLQLWVANDTDHRLTAEKLTGILNKGRGLFETTMVPVEVEYDQGVISQYPLEPMETSSTLLVFQLGTKHTACLAPERCGLDLLPVMSKPGASSCSPGCC
ncbi:DUF6428 family protein [Planctomicrobium sp. SH664]|uniref:DUF6428 family protein n=1 Tax=Planctomicrobium sp. SH664 TaxID=3448125 RepID=UPI003F5C1436